MRAIQFELIFVPLFQEEGRKGENNTFYESFVAIIQSEQQFYWCNEQVTEKLILPISFKKKILKNVFSPSAVSPTI